MKVLCDLTQPRVVVQRVCSEKSCVCLEESMSAKVEVVEKNVKTKKKQKGASLVEYALLVALIGVGAVAAMTLLRDRVSSSFSTTGVQMG